MSRHTALTSKQRASYVALLTRELQLAHLAWILDDAVMGVDMSAAYDVLADYGLNPDSREHRGMLAEAIAANLREGF